MNRRKFLINGVAGAALVATPSSYAVTPQEWSPAEFDRARKFVELPVGRIAYVERGAAPQAAIFLHGYPLNGFQWRGVFARLASQRRCIAPDLMGLGHSDVPDDADLSPTTQARMVLAFMDRLGIREADFVANDSSTGVAQLIAAIAPARVMSMLLTNGDVHTNSPPPKLEPFLELTRRGEAGPWFQRHVDDIAWARASGIGNAYFTPAKTLTPELVDVYFRPLLSSGKRRAQVQGFGNAMTPNPLPAIEPLLRSFGRPVRMVWGGDDDLFDVAWAHWLDRTLPNSRGVRVVPKAKLFFMEEQPEVIAEECRGLWRA